MDAMGEIAGSLRSVFSIKQSSCFHVFVSA